ncbi:hypothetical protein GCM10009798_08110 [Nocardioides panacihumi]|uniref:Uncharacterized protein n=1 Tax=Nocardioides panacihumi TaxID=400774 RepID=A0ABP5BVF1_9ACTN
MHTTIHADIARYEIRQRLRDADDQRRRRLARHDNGSALLSAETRSRCLPRRHPQRWHRDGLSGL